VKTSFRKISNERTGRVRLVQGVSVYPELDANGAGAEERLEDHSERSLPTMHSSIKKADRWSNLPAKHQHLTRQTALRYLPAQHRGHQHPAKVALVVKRVQILGHNIASIGVNTVIRPFCDGRRRW